MKKGLILLVAVLSSFPSLLAQYSGSATQYCWKSADKMNDALTDNYDETWFKSLRPSTVSEYFVQTAETMRLLLTEDVDPEVVDHVNQAIHYYESTASLLKTGNTKSWVKFLLSFADIIIPESLSRGLGGNFLIVRPGIGPEHVSEDDIITREFLELKENEARVIALMREKYDIDLKPW